LALEIFGLFSLAQVLWTAKDMLLKLSKEKKNVLIVVVAMRFAECIYLNTLKILCD